MTDNRGVPALRIAAVVCAVALVGAGCTSGSDDAGDAAGTTAVPKGFDVPAGVTVSKPGSKRAVGESATVVHQAADRAASAVTVKVDAIKKGSMKDFRFFSLDAETKKATPFYVKVQVTNEGPAGLGGAALPIYAHDDSNTNLQASDIVGTFKPCPDAKLPKSFLPQQSAELCLVYLVPKGRKLVSVDLQTGKPQDAITWKP